MKTTHDNQKRRLSFNGNGSAPVWVGAVVMLLIFAWDEVREGGKETAQLEAVHKDLSQARTSLNTIASLSNTHTARLDHLLERIRRIESALLESQRRRPE